MPDRLLSCLLAHIESVFSGPNGDYASILESLSGLSAAQAAWKLASSQNSIWQIVDHLANSKEWMIKMLEQDRADPAAWTTPSDDQEDWQISLHRLKDAHLRLLHSIEKLSEADLLAVPDPTIGKTLLELILSSGPTHDAHHGGQIDYLKGLYFVHKR